MTYSRLDYIFVSKEVLTNISSAKVDWAFESSDHAAVIISVKLNSDTIRGPGTIKLNSKLLNNPAIVKKIEVELETALGQAEENWNPHVKLEFMKVMIRSIFANETSIERNKIKIDLEDREITLNQMQELKIKVVNKMAIVSPQSQADLEARHESIKKSIDHLTIEIKNLRNNFSDTMAFSSKAQWYEKGEKSNKFFLNLNTMRQSQKLISNISDDSRDYKGQLGVSECIKNFYESLYKNKPRCNNLNDNSFYDNCPKLTEKN
jgi:hypothetical protein